MALKIVLAVYLCYPPGPTAGAGMHVAADLLTVLLKEFYEFPYRDSRIGDIDF